MLKIDQHLNELSGIVYNCEEKKIVKLEHWTVFICLSETLVQLDIEIRFILLKQKKNLCFYEKKKIVVISLEQPKIMALRLQNVLAIYLFID